MSWLQQNHGEMNTTIKASLFLQPWQRNKTYQYMPECATDLVTPASHHWLQAGHVQRGCLSWKISPCNVITLYTVEPQGACRGAATEAGTCLKGQPLSRSQPLQLHTYRLLSAQLHWLHCYSLLSSTASAHGCCLQKLHGCLILLCFMLTRHAGCWDEAAEGSLGMQKMQQNLGGYHMCTRNQPEAHQRPGKETIIA